MIDIPPPITSSDSMDFLNSEPSTDLISLPAMTGFSFTMRCTYGVTSDSFPFSASAMMHEISASGNRSPITASLTNIASGAPPSVQ